MASTARTRFIDRFDAAGMWLSLPTYFITWTILASCGGRLQKLPLALTLASVYTAAHVYEIRFRRHCFLSADSTAAPLAFLALVTCCFVGHMYGSLPMVEIARLVKGAALAFMAGHVAALSVAASLTGIGELAWILRGIEDS